MQENRHGRRRRIVVVCALALVVSAAAGPASAAKFAGAFMENGGGARALGMGGAFTAVASDASAGFWNPAGLANRQTRELLLMHSERFGDLVDRDFVAFAGPTGWALLGGESGGFAVSLIRLGIDDIPFTEHLADQLDEDGDGRVDDPELYRLLDPEFQDQIRYKSDQEFGLLVSYGERKGGWLVGGSLKFVRQSVGDYSSLGIGADLAAMRPNLWRSLDFGVKLQDITTTYLSWSTGKNEVINPAVVPGFAYRWGFPEAKMAVILATSVECRVEDRGEADQWAAGDFSFNSHWGLEVGFSERVYVRGGFDSGFESADLTAGAGLVILPLTVDYAYAGDTLDIDEVTHRISLSVRF
ncbi:MAG TPA: UPF0164 family protein [Candidatus Krumholzibacteria bacterium]|nr:UPF0164 family protein [Candidatus Krumholzibacteria bacterium]HPD71601.1 UPF0164 family protein [Candidatus Krumholzibacteria bacterium]HRY41466.1 UPF0164 family protein [Candidatus Krumholzibacteria bacterium]